MKITTSEGTVDITYLEIQGLSGVYASEYADGGKQPHIWSWSIRHQMGNHTIGGVISSLSQKGLVLCEGRGKESTIYVTSLGAEVAKELGLWKHES